MTPTSRNFWDYSNCCTVDYGWTLIDVSFSLFKPDQGSKGMTDQCVGTGYRFLESLTHFEEMWTGQVSGVNSLGECKIKTGFQSEN